MTHRHINPDMSMCMKQLKMIALFMFGGLSALCSTTGHPWWSRTITLFVFLWVGWYTPWIQYLKKSCEMSRK